MENVSTASKREAILQPSDYCLPLSPMARIEMDYNLKKLAIVFKFSLWTDRIFGPGSSLDRSFRQNVSQIFFRVQRGIFPISKGNRELYLWSFDEKTVKVLWHNPLKLPNICFSPSPRNSIEFSLTLLFRFISYSHHYWTGWQTSEGSKRHGHFHHHEPGLRWTLQSPW